jgi:1-acyl-sn-glycerol-3-phosphate acyltransferase
MRFEGLEHIPPSGGALLAYNHVSVLDPLVVAHGAARRGRPVRFLALADLFDDGIVGWSFRRTGQIPLRRGLGDWDAIEQVARVLRSGRLAGMAPEGPISEETSVRPVQRGAARLVLAAGVPLIPVGIWGTQARWSGRGLHRDLRRLPAGIVFGPALPPEGNVQHRPDVLALTDRITERVAEVAARARILASGSDRTVR